MLRRKVGIIAISCFFLQMITGCTNEMSACGGGTYQTYNNVPKVITTDLQRKSMDYTPHFADSTTAEVSTTAIQTTAEETTTVVETQPEVIQTEPYVEVTESSDNNYVENQYVEEPYIEEQTELYIPDDSIVIRGNIIPIVYGKADQYTVDTYDVVQDTGLIKGTNNTILFGHNTGSFSILNSLYVGDTIVLDNYGEAKTYVVQRSELAICNEDQTDANFLSDGIGSIYNDYGYPALVLVTCATGYAWNYRWVVIAEEAV